MPRERLLERIRYMEKHKDREITHDLPRVLRSIQKHLVELLNSSQGSVLIAQDFGMPDITNLPTTLSGEKIQELQLAITRMIQKYEPRIRNVRVMFQPSEQGKLELKYRLISELDDPEHPVLIEFDIQVDPGGKIQVNP